MPPITVLLVDDHAVVREGYRRLLAGNPDVTIVGEAANSSDALDCERALEPDVTVLDIALPEVSGIETLRRIIARRPGARVLMFSMYQDAIYASRAFEAGALGYLSKASAPELLVEAVGPSLPGSVTPVPTSPRRWPRTRPGAPSWPRPCPPASSRSCGS